MSAISHQVRQHRIQSWIAGLLLAWGLTQLLVIAVCCAGIGVVEPRGISSGLGRFYAVAFAASACPSFVVSFAALLLTLWNHRELTAIWMMLGAIPWLMIILETALFLVNWAA